MLSQKLLVYLEEIVKRELKWMYHYEIDDIMFGVETDKYLWCKRLIDGDISVDSLLQYFRRHYSEDEALFIKTVVELM